MTTLFVFCTALGAGVLLLQLLASVAGLGDDVHDAAPHAGGDVGADGLHLFSVRAVAAGLAAFGLAGLGARAAGLPLWAASGVAALAALGALLAVAVAMRSLLRLESDGVLRVEQAVGQSAVVYLRVPGAGEGAGKVHLTLQNRTVELQAPARQRNFPRAPTS